MRQRRAWLAFAGLLAAGGPARADLIDVDAKTKPGDARWTPRPTQLVSRLEGYRPRGPRALDRYGGLDSARGTASGFFRVEHAGERWWLRDPDGRLFLSMGIAAVVPGGSDRMHAAFATAFGSGPAWAESTTALLRSWGFNSAGAWSQGQALAKAKAPVAYAPVWNFMSGYGASRGGTTQQPGHAGYPNDAIFVFDPGFAAYCETRAKDLAATRDDPWLLGHFSDNELPWPTDPLKQYLSLPAGEAGRDSAQAWLNARKGKASGPADILPADEAAFRSHQADRYFAIVSRAIRNADPNHLYLGSRFHGRVLGDSIVIQAAGRYADAISFNWYGAWTPDPARMDAWERWAGKPFLITEWYAKSADAAGLANTGGAGWLVRTQRDRGAFYQNFALGLLRSKACLGWHWFKYQDNDPQDTTTDPSNRDSNKGVVDAEYRPYADLVAAMGGLNREAYSLVEFFDGRSWAALRGSPARRAAGSSGFVPAFAGHPGWSRGGAAGADLLDALGRWEPWPRDP